MHSQITRPVPLRRSYIGVSYSSLFLITLILIKTEVGFASNYQEQSVVMLDLGSPVESELGGLQKNIYRITLREGQFASLAIEQRGIDVVARIIGPDDKFIFEFDVESRKRGFEMPEVVAETSGSYRLEIEPKYKMLPGGRYEVLLKELRPAGEKDRSLQMARRLFAEALRLYAAAKFAEAQSLIDKVLEVRTRELGLDHAETARALNQLARIYDNLGNYDKAEETNRLALRIRERVLEPEHPDIALSLHNLAVTYFNKEDFPTALSFHQRALEIRQKSLGVDHPAVAVSLINMATIYGDQGDKSRAVEFFQRALAIQEKVLGQENLNTVVVLNNLGRVYVELGEYGKAGPLLLRALAVLKKLFPPDDPRMADPMGNLANLYVYQGDYQKAEPLYSSVLELREKTQGPNHPSTAQALHNLAELYFFKGDYQKSEQLFRRALELRESVLGPTHPAVARTLNGLSRLLALKGEEVEAVNLQRRANAISERDIELNLSIGSERQRLAYLNVLPEQTNQTISTHIQSASNFLPAVELAVTTILQRKGRVLDTTSASLTTLRKRFSPEDQELLKQLNDTNSRLAKLVLSGPQQLPPAEYQLRIKTLEDQREKLESQIGKSAGFFPGSRTFDLATVQAAIPSDAVLIEFAVYRPFDPRFTRVDKMYGSPHYVAYIIRRNGLVAWRELGEATAINQAIDRLRAALRDPKRVDVNSVARAADEIIMRPIRPLLGNTKHLLISPDGLVNLIPFEALVDENGQYLVQRYLSTYLTTGRDLLRLKIPRQSKTAPVVFANPRFGEPEFLSSRVERTRAVQFGDKTPYRKTQTTTRASDWSEVYFAPLSGTAQEAQAIKALVADASVLSGTQASESQLKKISAPKILHIATHGFFLNENSGPSLNGIAETRSISASARIENPLLRSGLALAGANLHKATDDDGILTALEASGLDLWGTKLVTLSACDTGLGEVRNGEGVYGLRRAFFLSGTETLVMSLWPVSDYVTRELMTGYYRALMQGQGRGESLRQVQLSMLRRRERQHPFFWASFIQSGEWANLEERR